MVAHVERRNEKGGHKINSREKVGDIRKVRKIKIQ